MTTPHPPLPAKRRRPPRTYPVCSLRKAMEIIRAGCGEVCVTERHGTGENKVIFLPEATRELEVMVSYGRRSPMNVSEQKYVGYGHYLVDEDGHTITIVKHFIEIQTTNRTAVGASNLGPNGEYNPGLDFLEYHREEFLRNEARFNTDAAGFQVDPFLRLCGPSEFVLEGHTHPDLGVFYSGTDKVSGAARAASAPVCVFVCDPIRKKMLGSIGKNFSDAEVLVLSRAAVPREVPGPESRLAPPADEIVRLAGQCLRTPGYAGNVRLHSRLNGGGCLKIKLLIPKNRERTEHGKTAGKTGG